MSVRVWIVSLIALTAGTAFAAKPQIQWDPDYAFSSIKTFQWRTPPGDSLAESDPFLHSHIVNAIEYQLTVNGLTEVNANPDIYVTYSSSTDTDVRLDSVTFGYSFGGYGLGRWGRYGYRVAGPIAATTSTRVVEVERGTLVVDIVAASTNQLIWRGTASGITVSDDPARMRRNVEKAIEAMAKQARKLQARAER